MAISFARVTVSTTAAALNTAGVDGQRLAIKNTHATDALILGDSSVAAGTGYSLAAGATLQLELKPGDVVYGIRGASADIVTHVLRG
jgi:hypothetical protein